MTDDRTHRTIHAGHSRLCLGITMGVLLAIPSPTKAGDLFTGFQVDTDRQYFGYLGIRTPIVQIKNETHLFVQAMTAGLGYGVKVKGQILDANVQFIVPSLGITHRVGRWTLLALAGPQLRRIEEERLRTSSSIDYQAGGFVQAEALYWHEKGNVHAIGSYADLDNFFWGRLRGKIFAYQPDQACCRIYVGWDLAGMGNGEFRAIQTGPLIDVPIAKV
ncbi:MAG: hypothetical protein NZM29_02690, partial [Nitrospira sp.]|nr:hypothetical protein [Nitrospira sp.]